MGLYLWLHLTEICYKLGLTYHQLVHHFFVDDVEKAKRRGLAALVLNLISLVGGIAIIIIVIIIYATMAPKYQYISRYSLS